MYKRKTIDTWEVQGLLDRQWECRTTELTRGEARQRLQEYRDNEPNTAFRLRYKRERIADNAPTWENQLKAAQGQISAELMRHALVSKQNRHRCEMCYCCAAWTVLEERGLLV